MKDTAEHEANPLVAVKNKDFLLIVCGFATYWAWTDSCFYSTGLLSTFPIDLSSTALFQIIGLATTFVISLVVAMFSNKLNSVLRNKKTFALLSLLASAGTVALALTQTKYNDCLSASLLIVLGIDMGLVLFSWALKVARSTVPLSAGVIIAGSIAVGGIAEVVASALKPIPSIAVIALFPLVGLLLFCASEKEPAKAETSPNCTNRPNSKGTFNITETLNISWRFIFALVAFSLATGMTRSLYDAPSLGALSSAMQFQLIGRYAVAAIAFLGATFLRWRPYVIYKIGALAVIGAYLTLPFLPASLGFIPIVITNAGYTCLELMIWTILFETLKINDANPLKTLGLGRLIMAAATLVGALIDSLLHIWLLSQSLLSQISSTITFLLVIATVLVLDDGSVSKSWYLIEKSSSSEEPDRAFLSQCEQIASRYELTPREHEVLELLAAGRSAPYIGNELGIAPSTVNYHVQHIYEKLNVRSKQALIDFVRQAE